MIRIIQRRLFAAKNHQRVIAILRDRQHIAAMSLEHIHPCRCLMQRHTDLAVMGNLSILNDGDTHIFTRLFCHAHHGPDRDASPGFALAKRAGP